MPLIVFEGIDGCGKTTQLERLEQRLLKAGTRVRRLREPGGTVLGEQQRAILLDPATRACPVAELFGYLQARAQLCDEVIVPSLAAGETVLLDRFYHSTIAYQAYGLGLDIAQVRAAIALAIGPVRPDLVLWLDLEPAAARARANDRSRADRIEARGLDYLRRVHAGYTALADAGELTRIDASADADAVEHAVWAAVAGLLS